MTSHAPSGVRVGVSVAQPVRRRRARGSPRARARHGSPRAAGATSGSGWPRWSRLVVSQRGWGPRLGLRVGGERRRAPASGRERPPLGRGGRAHRPGPRGHGPLHVERAATRRAASAAPARRRRSPVGSSPAAEAVGDVVGDAVREDEALEQRVGREPVGAVHAGARALAARVEPLERGAAEQVGRDPAAGVVLGRGDRQQLGGRVEARARGTGRRSTGSAARGTPRPGAGRRASTWSLAWSRIRRGSPGPRRRAARGRPARVRPCMNRTPAPSTRKAPSPRTASEMSGCWPVAPSPRQSTVGWNCTNSRSVTTAPARSAAAMPSPVATGRVGRRGVDLAEAAGREHDGAGVGGADPVDLALADDVQRDAADRAVVGGEQVDDERVLDDLDARVVDAPGGARR